MSNIIILDPQKGQPIEDYVEHDLPLLVKEKPKTLSWENHRCVIVGGNPQYRIDQNSLYERFYFTKELRKLGFDVFNEPSITWPRNYFLSFDDFLVGERVPYPIYTDGAIHVFGNDFVLTSNSRERNNDIYKRAVKKFWEAFGIEKVYFIPPAKKIPKIVHEPTGYQEEGVDLDWTIGSIPWLKIYTVDEEHYREQKDIFRMIEKENNIEFTPLPSSTVRIPEFRVTGPEYKESDLWVAGGYLALSKASRNKFRTTHLFYNNLTPILEHVEDLQNRDYRRSRLELHKTSTVSNILHGGTLHCFTHTAPDRQSYEEFRNRMGWNKA